MELMDWKMTYQATKRLWNQNRQQNHFSPSWPFSNSSFQQVDRFPNVLVLIRSGPVLWFSNHVVPSLAN